MVAWLRLVFSNHVAVQPNYLLILLEKLRTPLTIARARVNVDYVIPVFISKAEAAYLGYSIHIVFLLYPN